MPSSISIIDKVFFVDSSIRALSMTALHTGTNPWLEHGEEHCKMAEGKSPIAVALPPGVCWKTSINRTLVAVLHLLAALSHTHSGCDVPKWYSWAAARRPGHLFSLLCKERVVPSIARA